ncbi:MAG: type II secretion system F family protein [Bacteriovoracales bacterium]|nr:type II secretion system F family protein [Bacteriovoracales bacterium]
MLSLDIVAMVMVFISVFIVMKTIFEDEEQYKAQEVLENQDKIEASKKNGIVLRYSRPFFRRYIVPAISQMKIKKKNQDRYKRPLANAGLIDILTPNDFLAFKLFLILGFPVIFLILRTFLEETWPLSLIPALAICGFFYPDIWIRGVIRKRNKEILQGFPFIVDMLALSIEAGLDFVAAMQKIIDKSPANPIVDEFKTLIKESKVGASRVEVLRNLSWRVDLSVMASFCATLIAADSVGASIGPILKVLSGEVRNKRSSQVEKEGAQAASKMLLPMIFLVVPAVFLVIAAPLAIEAITSSK